MLGKLHPLTPGIIQKEAEDEGYAENAPPPASPLVPGHIQRQAMKARAFRTAYNNPLSSLVTLALLSHSKTAAVQAASFAFEVADALKD